MSTKKSRQATYSERSASTTFTRAAQVARTAEAITVAARITKAATTKASGIHNLEISALDREMTPTECFEII